MKRKDGRDAEMSKLSRILLWICVASVVVAGASWWFGNSGDVRQLRNTVVANPRLQPNISVPLDKVRSDCPLMLEWKEDSDAVPIRAIQNAVITTWCIDRDGRAISNAQTQSRLWFGKFIEIAEIPASSNDCLNVTFQQTVEWPDSIVVGLGPSPSESEGWAIGIQLQQFAREISKVSAIIALIAFAAFLPITVGAKLIRKAQSSTG